jgi:hypothetical protein
MSSRITPIPIEFLGGRCADFYSYVDGMLIATKILCDFGEFSDCLQCEEVQIVNFKRFKCSAISEFRSLLDLENIGGLEGMVVKQGCKSCNRTSYYAPRGEVYETLESDLGELDYRIAKRDQPSLRVARSMIGSRVLFNFTAGFLLCTDVFKSHCLRNRYSNIMFLEVGATY